MYSTAILYVWADVDYNGSGMFDQNDKLCLALDT